MKKICITLFAAFFAVGISACGNTVSQKQEKQTTVVESDAKEEEKEKHEAAKKNIIIDNLVTEAYHEEFGGRSFSIPQINLDGDAVKRINAEMQTEIEDDIIKNIRDQYDQNPTDGPEKVTYEWYVNNNILSLVIECHPVHWPMTLYYVYNVDITNSEELTRDDIVKAYGMSIDKYKQLVEQVQGSQFWSNIDRTHAMFESQGQVDFCNEQLQKTLSDENTENAIPYLNGDGDLCIIAKVYAIAGGDSYYHNLNTKTFTLVPDYKEPVQLISKEPETEFSLGIDASASAEEILAMVEAFLENNLPEEEAGARYYGGFVVEETDDYVTVATYYHMSEAQYNEIVSNGGMPSINRLTPTLRVDKQSGEVIEELLNERSLGYLW